MYKHRFSLLLLTLNVPLQISKCTPRAIGVREGILLGGRKNFALKVTFLV